MSDSKHIEDLNMMDSILYKEILPAISKQISSVAFELSPPVREEILKHKGNLYKKNICKYIDSQVKFFCSESERSTAMIKRTCLDGQNPKPSEDVPISDHQVGHPVVPIFTTDQKVSVLIVPSKEISKREGGASMAMKETEAQMNLQKVDIEIDATIISVCQQIQNLDAKKDERYADTVDAVAELINAKAAMLRAL